MAYALTRYAGHILIFAGLALLSSVIPSASGPADAIAAAQAAAVLPPASSASPVSPALLIASPRRATPARSGTGIEQPTAIPALGTPGSVGALAAPTGAEEPDEEVASPARPPELPLPPTDRIVIPRIRLDTKVVEVGVLPSGEMQTAAYAAGRLNYGAQAGETGNLVLAGHNDVLGEVFRRLSELQTGDEFEVYRGEQAFTYRVELRTIVREDGATPAQRRENARWLDSTDDAVATLVSCFPYRVDTHRVIVRAALVA